MLNRVTVKYFNNLIAIDLATNFSNDQIINIVNFDSSNKTITNDRVDVNTTNLIRFHWHPAERKKKEKKKENFLMYFFNILAIIPWNVKIRNVELLLVRSIYGRLPFVYRETQQVTYFRSAELQFTRNASFLNYIWKSDTGDTAQLRTTACGKEKKRERSLAEYGASKNYLFHFA